MKAYKEKRQNKETIDRMDQKNENLITGKNGNEIWRDGKNFHKQLQLSPFGNVIRN